MRFPRAEKGFDRGCCGTCPRRTFTLAVACSNGGRSWGGGEYCSCGTGDCDGDGYSSLTFVNSCGLLRLRRFDSFDTKPVPRSTFGTGVVS